MNKEIQAQTDADSSTTAELLTSANLAQNPLLNAVAVKLLSDKKGNELSNGDLVKIECNYQNDSNGEIHKLEIKYKGCKGVGLIGEGWTEEHYSILLDGKSWDSFVRDKFKETYTCNSLIKCSL